MKSSSLTTAAIVALAALSGRAMAQDYVIPANTPAYIRAAVESEARTADEKARDAGRKPAQILALSGIKPGDKVIEIAGFGNYYTKMLSEIVGENGRVSMFDLPYTGARAGQASAAFVAEHANTEYHLVNYNNAVFPQGVDIVYMVLYYHDLGLQDVDRAVLNRKLFAALKPGGAFLVVDHKAADGSGWSNTQALHRVDYQEIIKEVTAAGFKLEVSSDLLAHPEDDRSKMVFAPGERGETDRAVLLFRKPK
jgi:predicted methyltransferase